MTRRIGILGGTFDPLHNGHLACADAARAALGLDKVLIMPSGVPSFKQETVEASAADRLAMARAAVAGRPGFAVDDLEVDRSGVTYTADTLARLKERWPHADLVFILGADAARTLPTWDRPEELAQLARFAVVARAGEGLSAEEAADLASAGFVIEVVDALTPAVSSQEVRQRVRQGEPIASLVPPEVERYIMENDLYQPDCTDALSPEFYKARKRELKGRVGERRFEHSKGVAKTAKKLARAYGVDERKARLAGLLHDWDKAYDDEAELARVKELDLEIDPELLTLPRLLHGITAAAALARDYPCIPADVIEAVRDHTIADEHMTDLDMIVYIADALEPHREGEETEQLRQLIGKVPLRELFVSTYAHLMCAMTKSRKHLYSRTVEIWNSYMAAEGNYRAGKDADPFPQGY